METPFFFNNGTRDLFGVIHLPPEREGLPASPREGIVICHPFAEEKLIAHRTLVNLARSLAAIGHAVLRFDFMGHGDSGGYFEETTVESRLNDIARAVDWMGNNVEVKGIGLLGVRLGATLAALACQQIGDLDIYVGVSPIVNGQAYMDQCLRSNLTYQMGTFGKVTRERVQLVEDMKAGEMVNIDGYLLTWALYEGIVGIDLSSEPPHLPGSSCFIDITRPGREVLSRDIAALSEKYDLADNSPEFICTGEEHFWKDSVHYVARNENLENAVTSWLLNLG